MPEAVGDPGDRVAAERGVHAGRGDGERPAARAQFQGGQVDPDVADGAVALQGRGRRGRRGGGRGRGGRGRRPVGRVQQGGGGDDGRARDDEPRRHQPGPAGTAAQHGPAPYGGARGRCRAPARRGDLAQRVREPVGAVLGRGRARRVMRHGWPPSSRSWSQPPRATDGGRVRRGPGPAGP
ncbi:hypothetical protein CFC35_20890 [Streptomyces sp. FBKL.4005]|nr:hypothetical protein CFC35_20890 [Streptomyces sp. FBKL.4005]